jgi:hypothetical protein
MLALFYVIPLRLNTALLFGLPPSVTGVIPPFSECKPTPNRNYQILD